MVLQNIYKEINTKLKVQKYTYSYTVPDLQWIGLQFLNFTMT